MKTTLILMVAILIAGMSDAQERGGRTRRAEEAQTATVQDALEQPQYDGAHISFVTTKHDFGVVKRKGGDLRVRFEYVNDGTEPLVITRITTSCTCVRTDYRRRPLGVGERAFIELTYEPHKMEAGVFHKVIQIYSNSVDGMHLLTISGNSVE